LEPRSVPHANIPKKNTYFLTCCYQCIRIQKICIRVSLKLHSQLKSQYSPSETCRRFSVLTWTNKLPNLFNRKHYLTTFVPPRKVEVGHLICKISRVHISYACLIVLRGGADRPKVNPCCILHSTIYMYQLSLVRGNLISDIIAYRDDKEQPHCIRFVHCFAPDSGTLNRSRTILSWRMRYYWYQILRMWSCYLTGLNTWLHSA
jgi:hypothetical protein